MKKLYNTLPVILMFIFPVICSTYLNAQDSLWSKTFGGTNIDVAYAIDETSDEGYIIAGYTRSYGTSAGRNLWLFRTDKAGNLLWNKTFGGNSDDEAAAVKQTSDGGFIAAGYTSSFGAGAKDVYVVRTDSAGNELWTRTFGGSSDEEAYALDILPDGGFIIGCATSSSGAGSRDGWLIRLDAMGNIIWNKTLGGLSTDGIRGLQRTSDNSFIITGWTASDGAGILGNVWLVKTDSVGNVIFNKNFGGSEADRGLSVQQIADEGYILTGYTASSGAGLDDLLLIKTDESGNALWIKTFGGAGRDYGNAVKQLPDGNFIVAGYTLSYGAGSDDIWLLKTDTSGNTVWQKTFGGSASDVAYSMALTSDGGYVIAGHTLSSGAGLHDAWLLRSVPQVVPVELTSFSVSLQGDFVQLHWQTASETNNRGWEVEKLANSNFISLGFVQGAGNSTCVKEYSFTDVNPITGKTFYRLKQYDFDGKINYSDILEFSSRVRNGFTLFQNYPNPFNPSTIIHFSLEEPEYVELTVHNISGEQVAVLINGIVSAGIHEQQFQPQNQSSGIYFFRLRINGSEKTIRALYLR